MVTATVTANITTTTVVPAITQRDGHRQVPNVVDIITIIIIPISLIILTSYTIHNTINNNNNNHSPTPFYQPLVPLQDYNMSPLTTMVIIIIIIITDV